MQSVKGYLGTKITEIPDEIGIYAWYFSPNAQMHMSMDRVGTILANILNAPPSYKTVIGYRYGVRWESSGELKMKSTNAKLGERAISEMIGGKQFLRSFMSEALVPCFSRPLYIGISKNVRNRVNNDHYKLLSNFWEPSSSVSKYLDTHKDATVSDVMEALSIKHSFSLEARVRGININQLLVYVYPLLSSDILIKDEQELSDLESVLQWLADPVCGRA